MKLNENKEMGSLDQNEGKIANVERNLFFEKKREKRQLKTMEARRQIYLFCWTP